MRKQTIEYGSSIDALVAIAKRLSVYEDRYNNTSEDFYDKYTKGRLEDAVDYIEWYNDYQHYLAIRHQLERQLQNVA
jgi:hypothetical protein